MNVRKTITSTIIILLGPAGFIGTVALCNVVNAGVDSCTFAFAVCNCAARAE